MIKNFFLALALLIITFSCKKEQYFYIEGFAQGTTYHITYKGKENYARQISQILKDFDRSLSVYLDSSIISRVNRNDSTVVLDSMFVRIFNKSKEVYDKSNGLFDITVAPLVEAWGFLKDTTIHHDSAHIKELLEYVGMNKIKMVNNKMVNNKIVNNKIVKQNPKIKLDVNAIAQGYSVDIVSEFLDKEGSENYLVEIGGELRAKGQNPKDKKWCIGVDKPEDTNQVSGEDLQTIMELTGKSVSTSGNYRKFFIENGVKYSHTINPFTGFPAKNNLLSATIIADECITADAYATACMVGGLEKSKQLLKEIKGIDGYLVYSDSTGAFKVYTTPGAEKLVVEQK
jgi:FAD:protein FMN transferase